MPSLTGNSFDPDTDIPDLSGKVYVVTGGSSGIGFGIVAHLLQHNAAKIVILSNKEEHADEAIEKLKEFGDVSKVQWQKCNLADLRQTDEAARKVLAEEKRIDALILNAGLGVGKYWETTDGLDSHMQVNHFSQLHLLLTLLPNLHQTMQTRIVIMSSDLHRAPQSSVKFDSIEEINTDIGPMNLYNRTKLANMLTVLALQRRIDAGDLGFPVSSTGKRQIFINATHPGAVETDQQAQAVEAYGTLGKIGVKATQPFMKDPVEKGCRSALYAATSQDIIEKDISGAYIVPDKSVTDPSKQAQDVELGERLWKLSMEVLREKLG